jgi:2-dehydropantoate 2-reductase
VGGALAGGLVDGGHEVALVARGEHGLALAKHGLRLVRPSGEGGYKLPVTPNARVANCSALDAIFLCVKSQDSAGALEDLVQAGAAGVPLVCVQNGVGNERAAAAYFEHVYGMMVWMPATHLEPGVVRLYAAQPGGVLALGRFPQGTDSLGEQLCQALQSAGFESRCVPDIDAWKHGKLLLNLPNVIDAFSADQNRKHPFRLALYNESSQVLQSAGIEFLRREDLLEAVSAVSMLPIDGEARQGGSTWQSLVRGQPLEAEHINGYITGLGKKLGLATPYNDALLRLANSDAGPRSVDLDDLMSGF